MNRRILIAAVMVSALTASTASFTGCSKKQEQKSTGSVIPPAPSQINELPDLVVQLGDNSKISMRDLSGDILIVFFNPDCEHCQEEAREIAANKAKFEKWQLYFITSMEVNKAEEFAVNYRLTEPNYHFGHAGVPEVFNAVGALTQVPTILVYKNNRFINKFEGPSTIAQLEQVL